MSDFEPSVMRASGENLAEVLQMLRHCGAFLRSVEMEAVCYRVEFQHPRFEGCETQMLFTRDAENGVFSARISSIGPASVDTHPKDGNSTEIEVPLVSGAVPSEASADAPPPAPSLQTPQGGDS